ncbi:helix-turn-helix domain-containing protein [Nitrospinae bacterium AH_259_B05_G02_I21]|nr:helix-turn-helix domain-containing protein [Nitrospinae bacterium AH_259_B05_G02_I21]
MEGLINTEQAARYLGLSPPTLRWWRSVEKEAPNIKVGEAVRYRYETWRVGSTSESSSRKAKGQ